jgi:hypothetical protein
MPFTDSVPALIVVLPAKAELSVFNDETPRLFSEDRVIETAAGQMRSNKPTKGRLLVDLLNRQDAMQRGMTERPAGTD